MGTVKGRWLVGSGPGFLCVAPIPLSADRSKLLDVKENAKAGIELVTVGVDLAWPVLSDQVEKSEVGSE